MGAKPLRARPQDVTPSAFLGGLGAARRARLEVASHLGALGLRQVAVRITGQQIADASAVRFHRRPPATSASRELAGAAERRSYRARRPRDMRDITVPIGMPSISAISA